MRRQADLLKCKKVLRAEARKFAKAFLGKGFEEKKPEEPCGVYIVEGLAFRAGCVLIRILPYYFGTTDYKSPTADVYVDGSWVGKAEYRNGEIYFERYDPLKDEEFQARFFKAK